MTEPTTAGDAYDRVLLAGLNEHVFDLEDYDVEAATRSIAYEIPRLSESVRRQMLADTDEEAMP